MENLHKELEKIISTLRGTNGCPWDKKQTIDSMSTCMIEEIYEITDAMEEYDYKNLQEELGDVLNQIYMVSQIAKEAGEFDIEDVYKGINKKLITRHPHVFGNEKAINPEDALDHWDKMKAKEKKHRKSCLEGIPKALPSLIKGQKYLKKIQKNIPELNIVENKLISELKKIINNDKSLTDNELNKLILYTTALSNIKKVDINKNYSKYLNNVKKNIIKYETNEIDIKNAKLEIWGIN